MVSLRQRRGTRASSDNPLIAAGRIILSLALLCGLILYQQQQIPLEGHSSQRVSLLSLAETSTNRSSTAEIANPVAPDVKPKSYSSARSPIEIDIISIGSKTRPDYQVAQEGTFGSHIAVRDFFRITEEHDYETDCHSTLKNKQVQKIVRFCKRHDKDLDPYYHFNKMRTHYANYAWLLKKNNPAGWMCAQKRPADGFYHVLSQYKKGAKSIPDYLMVMDDDTYLDMEKVAPFIQNEYPADTAYAVAGCMIRSRMFEHNFTIPFGGWGMIFSRPTIENFQRPLHCEPFRNNSTTAVPPDVSPDEDFVQLACWRLFQDSIGELPLFTEGMSVAELMHAYAKQYRYTDIDNWQGTGFCLHSDWVWGYFVNFYHLSVHTGTRKFANLLEDRLQGYNESLYYAGRQTPKVQAQKKECLNQKEDCTASSSICHYVTPEQMNTLHGPLLARAPDHFKSEQ